jgi:hypothetical protein
VSPFLDSQFRVANPLKYKPFIHFLTYFGFLLLGHTFRFKRSFIITSFFLNFYLKAELEIKKETRVETSSPNSSKLA